MLTMVFTNLWCALLMCLPLYTRATAVEIWMKVESPTGELVDGMILSAGGLEKWRTNKEGQVNVTVRDPLIHANGGESDGFDFIITGKKELYPTLAIFGRVPGPDASAVLSPFRYTTFIGTRAEQRALGAIIGLPYDSSLGYIVVGMDVMDDPALGLTPSNLSPAVGASAYIEGIESADGSDSAFVFAPGPVGGHEVLPRGSSFVTFPNMVPGTEGTVVVVPPDGMSCRLSPDVLASGDVVAAVQAFPDAVSVVSYVCVRNTH